MILEGKTTSSEASNIQDIVDFTAEIDGVMFDSLINGIYSNKKGAGIREYSTNARDGHARAGKLDVPFDVSLPTRANPTFEVRDYGCSLTHDEVKKIYTVLGKSTKRDTNDETGCLGLGSKSAFAYTSTFTVTCFKDGRKRDYMCFLGENGRPRAALLTDNPTREPDGVRVAYAVKMEDIDDFNKEASMQLRGFNPQPNILRHNEKYVPLSKDKLLLEGKDWRIFLEPDDNYTFRRYQGNPVAIQGSVAYPINTNDGTLRAEMRKVDSDQRESTLLQLLEQTDICIEFPLGSLQMTTSREELAYTTKTCEAIANRMKEVYADICVQLDTKYAQCKTLKEARILRATHENDRSIRRIESILNSPKRMWNGQVIDPNIRIVSRDTGTGEPATNALVQGRFNYYYSRSDLVNKIDFDKDRYWPNIQFRDEHEYTYRQQFGTLKTSFSWRHKDVKTAKPIYEISADKISDTHILVDVEDKVTKGHAALMRTYWKSLDRNITANFLWVKAKTEQDAKEFIEGIYHDGKNVTYLHKLKPTSMPTLSAVDKKDKLVKKEFRVLRNQQYSYSAESNRYDTLDFSQITKKKSIPYVFFSKNMFYLTEKDMKDEINGMNTENMQRLAHNWLGTAERVYVINSNTKSMFDAHKAFFIPFKDFATKTWVDNNPHWKKSWVTTQTSTERSQETRYANIVSVLSEKGVPFPDLKDAIEKLKKTDQSQSYSRYAVNRSEFPMLFASYMEDEIKKLNKEIQDQLKDRTFTDKITSDPVLFYLLDQYHGPYNLSKELLDALIAHQTNKWKGKACNTTTS